MTALSIVVTGRNDGHGDNFEERLFTSLEYNGRVLRNAGIAFEYLWIEWNAVPGRPWLASEIVKSCPEARALIVSQEVHRDYCDNPNMVIMEFIAKNAGIRRAVSDFILTTNADILFSPVLVEQFKSLDRRRESVVYRSARRDLAPGVGPDQAEDSSRWIRSHSTDPPHDSDAAGDFLLATRTAYHALRGFNETIRFAKIHKDTQFCLHAHKLNFSFEVLGDIYHLYHANSWIQLSNTEQDASNAPWGRPYNYRLGVPYLNPPNWGLADYSDEPVGDRLFQLSRKPSATPYDPATAEPPANVDVVAEASAAWNAAQAGDRNVFLSEYVAGLARMTRAQPNPDLIALQFLRRYVQALWTSLLADPLIREKGVALYGAGRHARWMLRLVRSIDGPQIICILDDSARPNQMLLDIPVCSPSTIRATDCGAIVISSDLYETRMASRCSNLFHDTVRVIRIYEQLPPRYFNLDESPDANMNHAGRR